MSGYIIYYLEANFVCIIIFLIMLFYDLLNVDRQEKQIKYDRALIAFMSYFMSDAIWAGMVDGIIPRPFIASLILNFVNYALMAIITYTWLRYVMSVEQVKNRDSRAVKIATISPFLIATVALIVIYISAPRKIIDAEFRPTTLYSIFQITVPCIYIAAVFGYTLKKGITEKNPLERRKHLFIGLFPLMVVTGGLIQVLILPDTPVFCFSCAILMLLFYIYAMETRISTDPLTGLNNKGQLLRYVSQDSNLHMDGCLTYVIMADINEFKQINDTYGHAEGDHALKIVAEALRDVVKQNTIPIFMARYGGDEFTLIVHPKPEYRMDLFIEEIREQIRKQCTAEGTPYQVSMGLGYDKLKDTDDSFQKCMERADANLYLDKEAQKK